MLHTRDIKRQRTQLINKDSYSYIDSVQDRNNRQTNIEPCVKNIALNQLPTMRVVARRFFKMIFDKRKLALGKEPLQTVDIGLSNNEYRISVGKSTTWI